MGVVCACGWHCACHVRCQMFDDCDAEGIFEARYIGRKAERFMVAVVQGRNGGLRLLVWLDDGVSGNSDMRMSDPCCAKRD